MSDLIKDFEKLDVGKGDVVMLRVKDTDQDTIQSVMLMAEEVSGALHCMVIVLGPNDCLAKLDDDVMGAYGWYRKEEAPAKSE